MAVVTPPLLAWFAVALVAASLALGVLIGKAIRGAETPVFEPTPQPDPADLDDWLAAEEPLLDFKVYKRPSASTSTGGAR